MLNSTLVGLIKTFYGRFAGPEGNLKTEVLDVSLIDILPLVTGTRFTIGTETYCSLHPTRLSRQPVFLWSYAWFMFKQNESSRGNWRALWGTIFPTGTVGHRREIRT
jgi:hypothetical protein